MSGTGGKAACKITPRILLWPIVLGAVVCDLLGLCHLLPSHSQHLYRPYLLSAVPFKVFRNKN